MMFVLDFTEAIAQPVGMYRKGTVLQVAEKVILGSEEPLESVNPFGVGFPALCFFRRLKPTAIHGEPLRG
jgi:hypothetical protein